MADTTLETLADRTEAALTIDEDLAKSVLKALGAHDAIDARGLAGSDLDSTDQILSLICDALPGWTISVRGKSWRPNGHWTCSLRKTTSRDNDQYLGVGNGPTLPHSLLAALLRVLGQQT